MDMLLIRTTLNIALHHKKDPYVHQLDFLNSTNIGSGSMSLQVQSPEGRPHMLASSELVGVEELKSSNHGMGI